MKIWGGGWTHPCKTMKYIVIFIAIIQCCFSATTSNTSNIRRVMIQADWIAHVVCVSNATPNDTPHKDERFDETKMGTIAVAIADVFTNSGAFKGKKNDDFITFDWTDVSKYTAANWNAIYLWNWLFAYKNSTDKDDNNNLVKYTTNLIKTKYNNIQNIDSLISKAQSDFEYYYITLELQAFLNKRANKMINNIKTYDINVHDYRTDDYKIDKNKPSSVYRYSAKCGNIVVTVSITNDDRNPYYWKPGGKKPGGKWLIYKFEINTNEYYKSYNDFIRLDLATSLYRDVMHYSPMKLFLHNYEQYTWQQLLGDSFDEAKIFYPGYLEEYLSGRIEKVRNIKNENYVNETEMNRMLEAIDYSFDTAAYMFSCFISEFGWTDYERNESLLHGDELYDYTTDQLENLWNDTMKESNKIENLLIRGTEDGNPVTDDERQEWMKKNKLRLDGFDYKEAFKINEFHCNCNKCDKNHHHFHPTDWK